VFILVELCQQAGVLVAAAALLLVRRQGKALMGLVVVVLDLTGLVLQAQAAPAS
jgi:hypothetical protein